MANPKAQEVRQWMQKAEHDLIAATQLIKLDPPLTDIAVYHCQQAAEKALKAYLMEQDTPFTKTHDLDELVAYCASLDPGFAGLSEAAAILTPYAVVFRYPTGQPDPPVAVAKQAVEMAQSVVDFVTNRLPPAIN
jgi:HEPN domain-containing protein